MRQKDGSKGKLISWIPEIIRLTDGKIVHTKTVGLVIVKKMNSF